MSTSEWDFELSMNIDRDIEIYLIKVFADHHVSKILQHIVQQF